jgi:UDP-N-acetylglucosamine 2-epimerase (non-hydrolysing)
MIFFLFSARTPRGKKDRVFAAKASPETFGPKNDARTDNFDIMTHLRVLSIFGTRPEAVKMAPVIYQLNRTPGIHSTVCVTAQHRQMLDQVLNLFEITPDIDLDLMRPNQTLASLTASIFTHLEPVLLNLNPDWILIQGDTTTVMASALLAYYHQIRIGHVEAGLRTGNKWQPFPEEINRRVAGVTADLHFAPTTWACQNLLDENVPEEKIVVTGNPVIDALHYVVKKDPPQEILELFSKLGLGSDANSGPQLVVVTAHRRENFGQPIENICLAIKSVVEHYKDKIRIVYPVHLNPNIQGPVYRLLQDLPSVTLLPPLEYLSLIHLLKRAKLILTDSGGLQEEAPSLGVPVLVLRDVTERPEGVEAGTVRLVGTNTDQIVREVRRLLDNPEAHASMAQAVNPYGDGHAAERIVESLIKAR